MAKTTVSVAAMGVMLATGVVAPVDAAPRPRLVVVVHVTDYARVPFSDMVAAEQLASDVYDSIGVQLIWTGGAAATAPPDRAFHLDVSLLSSDMAAQKCVIDRIAANAMGVATRSTKRAYIFYARIAAAAAKADGHVHRLFGLVLAHEIGHVLLPAQSHSSWGIMSGKWYGPIVLVPGFTDSQATTIRALLTASGSASIVTAASN